LILKNSISFSNSLFRSELYFKTRSAACFLRSSIDHELLRWNPGRNSKSLGMFYNVWKCQNIFEIKYLYSYWLYSNLSFNFSDPLFRISPKGFFKPITIFYAWEIEIFDFCKVILTTNLNRRRYFGEKINTNTKNIQK